MRTDKPDNRIVLYQDENGITKVSVRFSDEDLWLTQNQIAEIYDTTKQNIGQHVKHILTDGELSETAVVKDFFTTAADGKNYNTRHYNLDMIIAIGYRVQSQVATRFRQWATQRLHEYIQKGFAMDDERLKQGGSRVVPECPAVHPPSPPRSFIRGRLLALSLGPSSMMCKAYHAQIPKPEAWRAYGTRETRGHRYQDPGQLELRSNLLPLPTLRHHAQEPDHQGPRGLPEPVRSARGGLLACLRFVGEGWLHRNQ
jgi:hypothetical protein